MSIGPNRTLSHVIHPFPVAGRPFPGAEYKNSLLATYSRKVDSMPLDSVVIRSMVDSDRLGLLVEVLLSLWRLFEVYSGRDMLLSDLWTASILAGERRLSGDQPALGGDAKASHVGYLIVI